MIDLFLFIVWHLLNSIWNSSISGVKSSWTTLYSTATWHNGKEKYADAPRLAARYLCDGGTLELVDGDACKVNTDWIQAVMTEAHALLKEGLGRDAKVMVLSVAGVQVRYFTKPHIKSH